MHIWTDTSSHCDNLIRFLCMSDLNPCFSVVVQGTVLAWCVPSFHLPCFAGGIRGNSWFQYVAPDVDGNAYTLQGFMILIWCRCCPLCANFHLYNMGWWLFLVWNSNKHLSIWLKSVDTSFMSLQVDLLKHGIPDPSLLTPTYSQANPGQEKENKDNFLELNEEYFASPVFVHTKWVHLSEKLN